MKDNTFIEAGKQLFAITSGVPIEAIKNAEGFVEGLLETPTAVRTTAGLMEKAAGADGIDECGMFRVVNSKIAAGRYTSEEAASNLVSESLSLFQSKQSKALIPAIFSGAASTAADVAKTTLLLAAAGGAAVGSGYWLLNNKMDEDNTDGQSRIGLEKRLRQYEKAIGNTERKNSRLRAHKVKQTLLTLVKNKAKGSTYEEVS